MNDFTKEELEGMLTVADSFLARGIAIYSEKITNKIQSMIDTHCTHAWMYNPYQDDGKRLCVKCRACKISNSQLDVLK